MNEMRANPAAGALVATALFLAALALRLELDFLPPGYPFLTFIPAVILTACVAGWRHATAVAVASAAAAWWLLMRVPGGSVLPVPGDALALLFFIAISTLEIALISALQAAAHRFDVAQQQAQRALAAQQVMGAELQHRVANNMQFMASLLALQAQRVDDPKCRQAFEAATQRLTLLGRLHRQLIDSTTPRADPATLIEQVCRDLLDAIGAPNVTVAMQLQSLPIGAEQLSPLCLIATELVTNAVKHAFANGRAGTITVNLEQRAGARAMLEIRDDGPGLPAQFDPRRSRSLGMGIVQSLAAQLGGEVNLRSAGGTIAQIVFPLAASPAAA